MAFNVTTTLYVGANGAQDASNAVVTKLQAHAWTVINADVTPKPAGFTNAFGELAEAQPYALILDRPGATQADAEADVDAAIHDVGAWSIVHAATGAVATVMNAAATTAKAVGDTAKNFAADPNAPKKAMSTLELAAIALIAVAGAVIVWKVAGVARAVTG